MQATKAPENKSTETTKIIYRDPGSGAVEFARQFVEGLTRDDVLPVLRKLKNGELHDPTDKRIKRCGFCGYFYRDKTKPNNSKTCSRECKIDRDTLNRAIKNADAAILKPKKEKPFEREMYECHVYWIEYPYYVSEHYMLERAHRMKRRVIRINLHKLMQQNNEDISINRMQIRLMEAVRLRSRIKP